MAVLTTPLLNKGSAFTFEEREALGLTGLLPPVISTLEAQVGSAYTQYQRLPDALSKNIYLTALHDRNEVLFFRVLSEHLREMIPIVNDRTVGLAMEQYHHECRRPRGVYLERLAMGGAKRRGRPPTWIAAGSPIAIAVENTQVTGEVKKCEPDHDFGYLIDTDVTPPTKWFPQAYLPAWHKPAVESIVRVDDFVC
jgi:hypothetical protein